MFTTVNRTLHALAIGSFFLPSFENKADVLLTGAQAFVISSIFDYAVQYLIIRGSKKQATTDPHRASSFAQITIEPVTQQTPSLQETPHPHGCSIEKIIIGPVLEELCYSVILLTESKGWFFTSCRWAAALFTGITAARTFTGKVKPEDNKKGCTLDSKIGLVWAFAREMLLRCSPKPLVILTACDCVVFALAEVCPPLKERVLPKFTPEWWYKVISSSFFRLSANTAAKTHSCLASIFQHILFNTSRAFGRSPSFV